jgi:PLP dependent protein
MVDTAQNFIEVIEVIEKAAKAAGRDRHAITLVAVSKMHGRDRIEPVLAAGHRVFGENRVQEAATKWPSLRADFDNIKLHLIGPLQTNKVREAVALFDVIESVDREKVARKLAAEMTAQGRPLPVLLQVNTGKEPQKSGVFPEAVDDFVKLCRGELGLEVRGLMAIPPAGEEPSPHFMLLNTLAKRNDLKILSMGMSSDYEIAATFGATHVRIGTAIFGERPIRDT